MVAYWRGQGVIYAATFSLSLSASCQQWRILHIARQCHCHALCTILNRYDILNQHYEQTTGSPKDLIPCRIWDGCYSATTPQAPILLTIFLRNSNWVAISFCCHLLSNQVVATSLQMIQPLCCRSVCKVCSDAENRITANRFPSNLNYGEISLVECTPLVEFRKQLEQCV